MKRLLTLIIAIFIAGCDAENMSSSTTPSEATAIENSKPQAQWEMTDSDIKKQGTIVEAYRNKTIFDHDLFQKHVKDLEPFIIARKQHKGPYEEGLFDDLRPKPFSIGYPIKSIEEEFHIDKATEKKHRYLPDWSMAEFSFDVGALTYLINDWRGGIDIEIKGNVEGVYEVELTKLIRIDPDFDSFESKRLTADLKTWPDGRFFIVFNSIEHVIVSPEKNKRDRPSKSVKCHTKDYRSIDVTCNNDISIAKKDVQMLTTAIEKKNSEGLMKDWIYIFYQSKK